MSTALTGAAGEHYVAYLLSKKGHCVGLSRGGSPFVDIMVSGQDGEGVSIQVKTSSGAWRGYKRKIENNHWEFDVGKKARTLGGPRLFYAFVDFKWGDGEPDVFVVPSEEVKRTFAGTNYARNMFWIMPDRAPEWLNSWSKVEAIIKGE